MCDECAGRGAHDLHERDLRADRIQGRRRGAIRLRTLDGELEFRERRCARIRHPSRGCGVLRKTFARDRPDSDSNHGPMRHRSTTVKSEWLIGPAPAMATRFAFWRKIDEDALAEKHAQPGLLSDFILGSQDGLVNVLGVILGVAVASRDITIILAGGLAATFAESISMGAVAYTSTLAWRGHYLAEVEREKEEMRTLPDLERQEVRDILERWDFHGVELDEMLEKIVWKPRTTIGRPGRSGTQMAIIGIASALAGFGIAYLVSGGRGL